MLLDSRAAYIGVLGPRARTEPRLLADLGRDGDPRLHAPIGLELGAETPQEIALAIAAEIQATLSRAPATSLRDRIGLDPRPRRRRLTVYRRRMRIALALLLLAGVARADDKPVPKADVDAYLAFFDKLVDIVAGEHDCDKLGAAAGAHVDANQALVDKANRQKADGYALPQDAQDHIKDGVTKMTPSLHRCGKTPSVRAAFDKLGIKK